MTGGRSRAFGAYRPTHHPAGRALAVLVAATSPVSAEPIGQDVWQLFDTRCFAPLQAGQPVRAGSALGGRAAIRVDQARSGARRCTLNVTLREDAARAPVFDFPLAPGFERLARCDDFEGVDTLGDFENMTPNPRGFGLGVLLSHIRFAGADRGTLMLGVAETDKPMTRQDCNMGALPEPAPIPSDRQAA